MPVVGPLGSGVVARGTNVARQANAGPGLAFLPTAVQGRVGESPQVGFLRPVVHAVFWTEEGAYSFSGQLASVGVPLREILKRLVVPRTGVGRAVQSLGVNYVLDQLFAALDPEPFGSYAFLKARQYAAKAATRFYRSYFTALDDGNVSVVFFPESEPQLDILKWDP